MKHVYLIIITMILSAPLHSAVKKYPIKNRTTIIQDGNKHYEYKRTHYPFRLEIISDSEGLKPEENRNNSPFVTARRDERYSVRLHNPLPVRVAVNLSVDGLNSITGKPSGIANGSKWIIEPHAFITIRGWQVNSGESRRFFFTDKPKSYAKWRSKDFKQDLSANAGVIGAAFFWSKKDLRLYFNNHPTYRNSPPQPYKKGWFDRFRSRINNEILESAVESAPLAEKLSSLGKREQKAGTGMGEKESHPTTLVNFQYDTGMYKLSQAVIIYYDFPQPEILNPFPNISFAPETPY